MKEKAKKIQSNAERQKKYRRENYNRINSIVSADTAIYLKLIAKNEGVTKKKALETIVEKFFREMTSTMSEEEIDELYSTLDA